MKKFKILLLLLVFSYCSQSSEMTMGVPEPYFGVEDMANSEVAFSRESSFSQGDYIIKTAYGSTDVSSSNFENTIDEVELLVKNFSGNISNTYLSTNYQGLKSYNLTMNIPAEDFENFLKEVEDISKFTNINLNANDVTKYVLDIDSRLKSLNEEKEALEEIKEEALSTSDKLQVQSQLRYINQDIQVLEGQKEYYENSVSYSSLTLVIREGSGVSLFSWNYYVQRALNWIESIIGFVVSFAIIAVPLLLLVLGFRKFRSKD
ncbi:MAG: DUF4349 domain-containing protein [Candidatus Actinomarina sp.]|nr:DUF4349 domain-containing protein [Candidatus Actinomarina sp.]MBL6762582.1 DUF4349 domain-containing protein [Candidatus Actinomarina sp.]MBL6835994.1 DUF4349 domain-containing protein [Candidatus Actinomarina sp.]